MKTWQKNKARSKWNRKKKKRKEPITVSKEPLNLITLRCVRQYDCISYIPSDFIEKDIARVLANELIPYINIQFIDNMLCPNAVFCKADIKVLNEGGRKGYYDYV